MAKQLITIGTPGAGGGDPAHAAFKKINDNATELYDAAIPDTEEKKTQARANLGLGTAATRNVGTAAGNVMEVGAFGLGETHQPNHGNLATKTGFISFGPGYPSPNAGTGTAGIHVPLYQTYGCDMVCTQGGPPLMYLRTYSDGTPGAWTEVLTKTITTVDSNGFIKAASPVVNLFADKIELNDEAKQQDISFEKLGIGDYLIKNSSGFAQTGWYIETPKDANGNVLFSVIYETLENDDISVKTYKKKFDLETASIVADLNNPVDITKGRWIDLRLQELPQPEIEISQSTTPLDFQPTNLAQAVAEALNNGTEQ